MSKSKWFDSQSNEPVFLKYMDRMENWHQALADGVVKREEVSRQAERVAGMLRALEPKLSDELHEEVTTILYELSVLYGMERLAELAAQDKGGQI